MKCAGRSQFCGFMGKVEREDREEKKRQAKKDIPTMQVGFRTITYLNDRLYGLLHSYLVGEYGDVQKVARNVKIEHMQKLVQNCLDFAKNEQALAKPGIKC